jgi:hypothetical protein
MTIVTEDTGFGDLSVEALRHAPLYVAGDAELVFLLFEQKRKGGVVGQMTDQTVSRYRRRMAVSPFDNIIMALEAEISARGKEPARFGSIMAVIAFLFFVRKMGRPLLLHFLFYLTCLLLLGRQPGCAEFFGDWRGWNAIKNI